MSNNTENYYTGPERRLATQPRRNKLNRRHRLRTESLVCDCRTNPSRRKEDEDGFVELAGLYDEAPTSGVQPQKPK